MKAITWDLNDYIGSNLQEHTLRAYNIFLTILLSTIVVVWDIIRLSIHFLRICMLTPDHKGIEVPWWLGVETCGLLQCRG